MKKIYILIILFVLSIIFFIEIIYPAHLSILSICNSEKFEQTYGDRYYTAGEK